MFQKQRNMALKANYGLRNSKMFTKKLNMRLNQYH